MAGLKEIKRRLTSVRNTKKITYAMKLVSAARLRKAQEAVASSRDYTNALTQLLGNILAEMKSDEVSHPLMEQRSEVKKVALLVIGGNRGLSGPYNANINKKVDAFIEEKSASGIAVESILLGKKPSEYFRRKKRSFSRAFEDLSDYPNDWPTDEVCKDLEVSFKRGEIDEAYFIYTRFKSAISTSVMVERLLPMDRALFEPTGKDESQDSGPGGKKIFEPSVDAIFSAIMPRILRSRIRQACLDAKASEYGSRMTAMDAATKNAGELSEKLKLKFNNLRQANITAELLDILGGSEAVK